MGLPPPPLPASVVGGSSVGANGLGQHQTMFFGPAHSLTQYSSLPRRSHMHGMGGGGNGAGGGGGGGPSSSAAFQRNTPIRRSTGIPEHHMEYFVPRSISEFNLSGVGDLALPPPRRFSPNMGGMAMPMGVMGGMSMVGMGGMGGMGMPHGLQLGPPQTLLCTGATPTSATVGGAAPPPAQLQIVTLKPRSEKMVTFEDESKSTATAATVGGATQAAAAAAVAAAAAAASTTAATHCPHGVPTTPRKSNGGNATGDIFM